MSCLPIDGFASVQSISATTILDAVKQVFAAHTTTSVLLIGHSLGAAISTLDAVYLMLWLPSSTQLRVIIHGSPRVGNQAFANYVDAEVCAFSSTYRR